MSYNEAKWKKWNNASFFGASFIWTTLHNYAGTDGIKGDLARVNNIPFDATLEPPTTSIIGSGATPEGIDQNPAYYEFVYEQPFRTAPVPNLAAHMIQRSHQCYGLIEPNQDVSKAWALLVDSLYATDMSLQDHTGIAHLQPRGGDNSSLFELDRYTPKPIMCKIFGKPTSRRFHKCAPWVSNRTVCLRLGEPWTGSFGANCHSSRLERF
jgi:hypothetical protein